MSVKAYDKGDGVSCEITFFDDEINGNPTDPTTVIFRAKKPSGALIERTYGIGAEIVRDSVGKFRTDLDVDESGDWAFRWEGTGAVKVAEERHFIARGSVF